MLASDLASPVPSERPLAALRARIRTMQALPGAAVGVADFRHAVRDVVVVGSSSRGGSSIFSEILRRSRRLLHFRGEVNPFFVLNGEAWPESGAGSDALHGDVDPATLDAIGADMAADCGLAADGLPDEAARWRFAVELACRLTLQWPALRFEPDAVLAHVEAVLATLRERFGWAPGEFRDTDLFHVHLLARLRARHPEINPYCYDVDRALVHAFCPEATPPEGPPGPLVVEEPPFVTIRPWRLATREELATRAVVVKTPSNAYRMPFLRALFPNARIRVLHLTRNVAASVNGLYDGWRFHGFYAHAVDTPLGIRGYSDQFPAWGTRWWKFDLPPGWQAHTHSRLEEVCAFQWRSAHTSLLDWLDAHPGDHLRLRFEHVLGSPEERREAFGQLGEWLHIGMDEPFARAVAGTLPLVMATERPRQRRWFARAELLEPVLADPLNRSVMERLGYAHDRDSWT